jgi:hypothetical protein
MTEVRTLDQIKADLALAIASGNDGEVMRLSKAIMAYAADIKKIEADKLKAEAEALAGIREALEAKIYKAVMKTLKPEEILSVKAKGFTIVVDHLENDKGQLDPAGQVAVTGACKLMVPTIKAAKVASTGGTGGTGVTVESQTGMKRAELIDKYATDEEKATIESAKATAQAEGKNVNSVEWAAGKPVVKRILADHPELIKK